MVNEKFIRDSVFVHGNRYDYSLVEYKNNKTKVKIICKEHGVFEQTPVNHVYFKCNCPICSKCQKINNNSFIERLNKIHDNKFDYSLIDYKNMHTKIKIICPTHGVFEQTPHNHIRHGCKKCSFDKLKNDKKEIISRFEKIHGILYDYSSMEYKSMRTKIKIICPVHGVFEQTPVNHLQGKGCYNCSSNSKKDICSIIDKLNKIHDNKYQYEPKEFNKTSNKIKIICKEHGEFFQTLNNHLNGHGCPLCNESKGEIEICNFLNDNKINYIRQKTFLNCKNIKFLPFDFYLSDLNICIEYDGEQHFKMVEYWGGEKTLNRIKKCDDIKNEFCNNNLIKLIRIDYNENIIEKLKNNLIK